MRQTDPAEDSTGEQEPKRQAGGQPGKKKNEQWMGMSE